MRVLVVHNPRSGIGDAGLYDFVHELGRSGCEITIRYMNGDEPVRSLVDDAASFDRVVASGGDGSVSSICYALRYTQVPVLAYPAGTANLIASNLRLPTDPLKLAKLTLEGPQMAFDIGELTHLGSIDPLVDEERCGFMVIAGAGYDAAIMERAQQLKATLGVFAYVVGVMQTLAPRRARFRITIDGKAFDSEGIAVLVVNFAKLQFDLAVTHGSDPRDGVFEVAIAQSKTAVGLLPAVWSAVLDRVLENPDRSRLDVRPAREILVESDPPLRLQYDGEALDLTTPLGARVLPGAARLIVPSSLD